MARIISIAFTPHLSEVMTANVLWTPSQHGRSHDRLPQLVWSNGEPWREVNLWLHERADFVHMRTVESNASAILGYAKWLESTQTNWRSFPTRKSERCLVRYRGALIEARREGRLGSSTVSQRMRQVIAYYRWANEIGLVKSDHPMWRDSLTQRKIEDSMGFQRTILVQTTDLKISHKKAIGEHLEDRLMPVSKKHRSDILRFVKQQGSEELFLMLALGFYTGMRIGTISDLKVETLINAIPDPNCDGLFWLSVGPGATPRVATKLDVTGQVWVSRIQLHHLRRYATSMRRAKREALAAPQNKSLLFLTRYGNAYTYPKSDKSGAINVQMHALRKIMPDGEVIRGFHFHQSRATFGTELARVAVAIGGPAAAIGIVMQALLQSDEQSALKYIKFVERSEIRQAIANEFTELFLGLFPSETDWFEYD